MSPAAQGFVTAIGIGAAILGAVALIATCIVLYRNRRWPKPVSDPRD